MAAKTHSAGGYDSGGGKTDRTSTLTPAVPLQPRRVLDAGTVLKSRFSYLIERPLGRGGYATVYLARCLEAGEDMPDPVPQQVAVKVFSTPVDADPARLLKRELSSLLALRHQRIIRVYDMNLTPPNAFVVLHYHPAGNLFQGGSTAGLPCEEDVWRLLDHLMSALSVTHRASILHLDIKPDNVLVDDERGFVLTDFGVSQGSRVSRSQMEFGLGSPGYQSPEQYFRDMNLIGVQTDLWGVGATAYAYFTGLRLNHHLNLRCGPDSASPHGLPLISERRRCSPALEQIVMSLLMFDPGHRPGSAADVLAMVTRHVSGAGIEPAVLDSGRRANASAPEVQELLAGIVDPLWAAICRSGDVGGSFVLFQDSEILASQGDLSRQAFVLLRGQVAVEQAGTALTVESREGTFLGEVSALAGLPRTTTLRARGAVWALAFNAAQLEHFVASHPALSVRLLKALAVRLAPSAQA